MASRPRRNLALPALAVFGASLAGLPAQTTDAAANGGPGPARAVVRFTAPDGSHFVLVPDARTPQVHWAIATFVEADDEPAGLEGLAYTTARASLGGTWSTGSTNVARERQALEDLDDAWQNAMRRPGDAAASAVVVELTAVASGLGDAAAFQRVLAGLPAHRPEVFEREPVCLFVLTTLPQALGEVGRLLVERREQQALRELPAIWMKDLGQRLGSHFANPANAVRSEVLALAMPNHPACRWLDRPQLTAPRRDQALAVWESTQRPDRTVHVLFGDFDATAAAATLTAVFTTKPSSKYEPRTSPRPRPFQVTRRSVVPGVSVPMLALAWVLPPIEDRFVLEAAVHWLADGTDSRIGQALLRAGRNQASVQGHAPWPRTADGMSLLLLEVRDPQGTDKLGDLVITAANTVANEAPTATSLQPVLATMQRRWNQLTEDPREMTLELAETTVLWPQQTLRTQPPDRILPEAVRDLLMKTFAGQPVVVEGRQ